MLGPSGACPPETVFQASSLRRMSNRLEDVRPRMKGGKCRGKAATLIGRGSSESHEPGSSSRPCAWSTRDFATRSYSKSHSMEPCRAARSDPSSKWLQRLALRRWPHGSGGLPGTIALPEIARRHERTLQWAPRSRPPCRLYQLGKAPRLLRLGGVRVRRTRTNERLPHRLARGLAGGGSPTRLSRSSSRTSSRSRRGTGQPAASGGGTSFGLDFLARARSLWRGSHPVRSTSASAARAAPSMDAARKHKYRTSLRLFVTPFLAIAACSYMLTNTVSTTSPESEELLVGTKGTSSLPSPLEGGRGGGEWRGAPALPLETTARPDDKVVRRLDRAARVDRRMGQTGDRRNR